MLKKNKKNKQQDRHRWLLIGFLCLFGVCLVAQVRPTGQKPTAGASTKSTADTSKTAPKTKTPAGNKKQSDNKKQPENKKTKVYLLHADEGQADKLAKRHNGSGILPYPEEVQALLSLITEYPQISFSIKMRLGWEDPEECLKLAPIINELPLRQVVMHPRLGKQQYKGEVDLKAFEAFQNACKHPLIYNGDINSVEDIHRIQEQFPGLAGMMIGRGLLANPALALEYRQNRALEFDEMREKLQSMHKCVYNQYAEQLEGGDEQLLNKMKTFWEYLMPQADRKLLKAIHKSTSLNKYNQAILAFFNQR